MLISPENWKSTPGISIEGAALEVVKSTTSMSVLAGPGAGKTELLAQRAVFLLSTRLCTPPKRILAITFKVDAARNLLDRVQLRSEHEVAKRFESLTLHAFAKRTLDQFREALEIKLRPLSNYKIFFPSKVDLARFQDRYKNDYPDIGKLNLSDLTDLGKKLPGIHTNNISSIDKNREIWWSYCIESSPSVLTFDMIMVLAAHIIRTHEIIKNAISSTYSHVFLDEFQDVSGLQYDLISCIFKGSNTVVTAVGDTNQAIMGWAGALPDIFNKFAGDFIAENRTLLFNFRSNSKIVEVINNLSRLIAPSSDFIRTESSRSEAEAPNDALEGWVFPTRAAEGEGLARFVRQSLLDDPSLGAHDFVILTRIRADEVERRLAPYFAGEGLRLRNDARLLGPSSIQDLVKEKIFEFLASILKMVHGVRSGNPFRVCRDILADIEGLDLATDRGTARSLQLVQSLVAELSFLTKEQLPTTVSFPSLMDTVFTVERREKLGRSYKEYQNSEYLDSIINAVSSFLDECSTGTMSWRELIDNLEGRGSVKLMTIHKSKGLEYNMVIFTEFNDDSFWNNHDDVNVFFVALSRAREKVRFSLTLDSRGHNNVEKFIEMLVDSGVEFKEFS
ncbi:UvrD-helicase domain-containing protein [Comamonas testosteroni]|uniref:UvrD-helicase domain-containing protein n=1 Tax=Comamonas testosteroni TaxID=285 RepID=UPI0015FCE42C|nr:ATP-dependent helicase [Comamonas testosteroni]